MKSVHRAALKKRPKVKPRQKPKPASPANPAEPDEWKPSRPASPAVPWGKSTSSEVRNRYKLVVDSRPPRYLGREGLGRGLKAAGFNSHTTELVLKHIDRTSRTMPSKAILEISVEPGTEEGRVVSINVRLRQPAEEKRLAVVRRVKSIKKPGLRRRFPPPPEG